MFHECVCIHEYIYKYASMNIYTCMHTCIDSQNIFTCGYISNNATDVQLSQQVGLVHDFFPFCKSFSFCVCMAYALYKLVCIVTYNICMVCMYSYICRQRDREREYERERKGARKRERE